MTPAAGGSRTAAYVATETAHTVRIFGTMDAKNGRYKMITKDEAIKAAETLKEWCGGKPCNNCPFGIKEDEGEYRCYFALGGFPARWKIPKACRWTKTDLELAKALKAVGAQVIVLTNTGVEWRSKSPAGTMTARPARPAPACTARGTRPARPACCRGASNHAGRRTNDLR